MGQDDMPLTRGYKNVQGGSFNQVTASSSQMNYRGGQQTVVNNVGILLSSEKERYDVLSRKHKDPAQTLTTEEANELLALKNKKCSLKLGIKTPSFSYITDQLSPENGAWCAFFSSLFAAFLVASVTGWVVAGANNDAFLLGPSVWGISTAVVGLITAIIMCPSEINPGVVLAKFLFDDKKWDNVVYWLAHLAGSAGGFALGYYLCWLVFGGSVDRFDAVATVVDPFNSGDYNVGRAIVTEAVFTFILVLGVLTVDIIGSYWLKDKGFSYYISKAITEIVKGFLVFVTVAPAWGVTGGALNFFRAVFPSAIGGYWNPFVPASAWAIYVGILIGWAVAVFVFWADRNMTQRK